MKFATLPTPKRTRYRGLDPTDYNYTWGHTDIPWALQFGLASLPPAAHPVMSQGWVQRAQSFHHKQQHILSMGFRIAIALDDLALYDESILAQKKYAWIEYMSCLLVEYCISNVLVPSLPVQVVVSIAFNLTPLSLYPAISCWMWGQSKR